MGPVKMALEPSNTIKAFVIEDKKALREDIAQDLEKLGYSVDAFETPREAASKIANENYQLSVIDIDLGKENISGEEFVRKNLDVLGNGIVVAYTAHGDGISEEDEKLFDKIFIKVTEDDMFAEYVKKVYESNNQSDEKIIDITKTPEWNIAKERLIKSLAKTKDKKAKILWYKENNWSSKELLDAVNDVDSEIGKSQIRMMLNWLKRKGEIK